MPASLDFSGLTFPVDSVIPVTTPLATTDLKTSLEAQKEYKILQVSNPQVRVKRAGYRNCLIDAVSIAYAQHLPLVLSPDAVWLTLAQGFANHIRQNAEAFRGRLVRHSGKKALTVSAGDWATAIAAFARQIEAETDVAVSDALVCNFSTTTDDSRIASQVVLMDAYEKYFEYTFAIICGIPQITLQGTAEDWRCIRERIEVFATFGLEWWVSRLCPILDAFVTTIEKGDVGPFWSSIYLAKPAFEGGGCFFGGRGEAMDWVNGWVVDLFPYLGEPPNLARNEVIEERRRRWTQSKEGVSAKRFPSSRSVVPVNVRRNRSEEAVTLLAGLLGVCQNSEDLAVAPLVGWAVAQPLT